MTVAHVIIALSSVLSMHIAQAQIYYYYTGGSPVINSNSCPISNCTQCQRGYYNSKCGQDPYKLNVQNCQECPGLPSNANWLPWGPYPDGIGWNSSVCKWECNYQYRLEGDTCTRGNCTLLTVLIPNSELMPEADYPNCSFRCKAGYYGTAAVDPINCSSCDTGKYATAGSVVCSECPAGTYLDTMNGKALNECKVCPAGGYCPAGASAVTKCPKGTYSAALSQENNSTCEPCAANFYSLEDGSTSCTPCAFCSIGEYKSGCGGMSAGVCLRCSNTPF
jgi:hypothetical protein